MSVSARSAADEFAVRYYRWALDDVRREVQEDFPHLRPIKSGLVLRTIAYLESFGNDDRPRVVAALVKRFHRRAVELTRDSWGPEEERIAQDFVEAARIWRPEEEWVRHALLHDPAKLKIDRKRFLAAVRAELAPILGSGEPFSSKHEWRYATPIGPWTLVTFIDVGGRTHQLSYMHTIQVADPRRLAEALSICSWLGIAGQTTWDRLTGGDTPAAAQSLARVCAHFLKTVPALVADLSPE